MLRRSARLREIRARVGTTSPIFSRRRNSPVSPKCDAVKKKKRISRKRSLDSKVPASVTDLDTPVGTSSLSREWEEKKIDEGYDFVIGVDEAGRGPLCGPVVAAAAYIKPGVTLDGVTDSKKINEAERERIFAAAKILQAKGDIDFCAVAINHDRIDEINIREATKEAMQKSVVGLVKRLQKKCRTSKAFVYVDGNFIPSFDLISTKSHHVDGQWIIKGDSKVFSIGLASVIAKVSRDRIMLEHHKRWPMYGFAQHKGYGTRDHVNAIYKFGPCDIHRKTFAPIKTMISKE